MSGITDLLWKGMWLALLSVGILNILPNATIYPLPQGIKDSIIFFIQTMKNWNWLFNFDALFACFITIIIYEVSMWAWFKIVAPLIKIIGGENTN